MTIIHGWCDRCERMVLIKNHECFKKMKDTFSNYNCFCGGTYIIWRFTNSSCKNPHLIGVCYKCGDKINLRKCD